jgi:hypothetical protein
MEHTVENLKQLNAWLKTQHEDKAIDEHEWAMARAWAMAALKSFEDIMEELEPYREAAEEQERQRQREERLTAIVNLLFPKYDARWCDRHPEEKPPIHPIRSWWWNGARLTDGEERGSLLRLEVTSYVGGGNMDDCTVGVPLKWLTSTSLKEDVFQWIGEETDRIKAEERNQAVASVQHELARLNATLEKLGVDPSKTQRTP